MTTTILTELLNRIQTSGDYIEGLQTHWVPNNVVAQQLIASEQVVVLPCKIGSTIYHIDLEIPENEPQCSGCKDNYSGFGEFYCDNDYLGWPSFEDKLNNRKDVCPKFKPIIRTEKFTLSFWASYEKYFSRIQQEVSHLLGGG